MPNDQLLAFSDTGKWSNYSCLQSKRESKAKQIKVKLPEETLFSEETKKQIFLKPLMKINFVMTVAILPESWNNFAIEMCIKKKIETSFPGLFNY